MEMALKRNERRGSRRGPLAVALVMVLTLSALPVRAAGRRGANVVVRTGLGYSTIEGELIAVKPASLLVLGPLGADVAIDIAHVRSVEILRPSRGGLGATVGLIAGAAGGYLIGYSSAADSWATRDHGGLAGIGFGVLGGLLGLGAGAVIGSAAGRDVVIPFGGLSRSDLTVQLKKLRRYARVAEPL
jgi:hypothetical protein